MVRVNRLLTILLLVALLLSACQPIQPVVIEQAPASKLDGSTIGQIETLVKTIMDAKQVPGVAVGIVKAGELVYAKGFGVAELGMKKPVTPESVFFMASIAKSVTGMAIMQLVEEGKIELDAPVTAYLPYFTLADPAAKEITIRQLLSHTSGMSDYGDWMADIADPNKRTDDSMLEDYVRSFSDGSLLFAPGKNWSYSNSGFDTLGDVIAKVSGQSYEDYVQEHILTPLGMKDSTFLLNDVDPAVLVAPHTWNENGKTVKQDFYPYLRKHGPSATFFSSVRDMVRFAVANMNHGELDGMRVLPSAAYDELWAPQAASTWVEMFGPQVTDYGLGWWVGKFNGQIIIGNYGAEAGFQSHLGIFPDEGFAVIAMVNAYDPAGSAFPAYDIGNGVAEVLLGTVTKKTVTPTAEEVALNPATTDQIETILTNTMQSVGVPGYAMCIVKDGNVVYNKGFGVTTLAGSQPVTPQSVFSIRSTTKSFTAIALMQLVEQGKIDLDAPVTKYLPYFTMADPAYQQITVRMLASHTSGLIDDTTFQTMPPKSEEPDDIGAAIEWFVRSLADDQLTAAPPTVWQYAGANFILLGDIIGKVSGEPYDVYITKHLLEPLGMTHSTLDAKTIPAGALVGEHVTTAGVVEAIPLSNYGGFEAPEGGIYSTCDDMTRWMQVHLNRGELDGVRILQAKTYDILWKRVAPTGLAEIFGAWLEGVGVGWCVADVNGHLLVGHPGGGAGQDISFELAPNDHLGVTILANWGTEPDAYPAWTSAADVIYTLLGINPQ